MKIAAVKKFTQVLVAMAVAAVMAALLCAPKALGTTIGEFSIEQIYVNVPELDVFVQATDAQGQPISPDLVRAAGVELYLGDEKIPTGNIGMANEPIGMQRFAGLDHDGRFERKGDYLGPLFLKGQIVALHELRIDAGDFYIFMAACVDYEKDASVLCIMLF